MIFPSNYLKIALLGTRKTVAAGATGQTDLDALLEKIPGQDTAATWSKLATIYVYSRGKKVLQTKGTNSGQTSFSPLKVKNPKKAQEKAEEQGKKSMPPQLLECLEILKQGKFDSCWQEFLEIVEKENYQFPAQSLPFLLDKCLTEKNLRKIILNIAGKKGKWLVNLNSKWEVLKVDLPILLDSSDLEKGKRDSERGGNALEKDEKIAYFRDLRAKDPKGAREFLQQIWTKQKADEKLEFLEIMETSLELEDEEILEKAFKDRVEKVRMMAHLFLTKIPGSEFYKQAQVFWKTSLADMRSSRSKYEDETFLYISLKSLPLGKISIENFLENLYLDGLEGRILFRRILDAIIFQKEAVWAKALFNRLSNVVIKEYPSKIEIVTVLPEKDKQDCLNLLIESVAKSYRTYRTYGNFYDLENIFSLFKNTVWSTEAANLAWTMAEEKMASVLKSKRDLHLRTAAMHGIYHLPRILEKLLLMTETSLLPEKLDLLEKFTLELSQDKEIKHLVKSFTEIYETMQFRLKLHNSLPKSKNS